MLYQEIASQKIKYFKKIAYLEKLIEQVMKIGPKEDIDDADEEGRTPLMMAAYNGKLDCVRMLVLKGKANIKAVDEKGKTARGYAESRKHDKIIAPWHDCNNTATTYRKRAMAAVPLSSPMSQLTRRAHARPRPPKNRGRR